MEIWDVMDAEGQVTGRTILRGDRLLAGQYHLVTHIWIVNAAGHLLIQRRADSLKLLPGIWAVTSGSAVTGEDSLTAARRELREELGIAAGKEDFHLLGRLRRRNSFCDLWLLRSEIKVERLILQENEVAEARWVSFQDLRRMVDHGLFHNYGNLYFKKVQQYVQKAVSGGTGIKSGKTKYKNGKNA
ncbi:MAG: NUDIX domain-containing protein [Oscillospiraceae bacterium]|nr:NUDIX domain-containing protein [Oscillospiraceae bacterium]